MKKVVDLSQHNGNFNLQELKDNGIEGVILRLCWIGNKNNHTCDTQVENYYRQAKNLGLSVGFYVYSYCESIVSLKSGMQYIDHLLEDLGITQSSIFLDLEDPQIEYLSKGELTDQALYFCNYYILRGYKSGIYASKDWFINKLDVDKLLNYKIWLAEWGVSKPTVSFRVDIWQYTSEFYINGRRFDANECYCDGCNNDDNNNNGGDFEVKTYKNGSTTEYVYQDLQCTKQIGYLHPRETAECYGVINNRALIVYTIDGTQNKKSGFVKWLGGII